MFMDEAGHYFYQSVPGQQQMVVMTAQGNAEVDTEGNVVTNAATPTVVSSSPQVMLHATDPLADVRIFFLNYKLDIFTLLTEYN